MSNYIQILRNLFFNIAYQTGISKPFRLMLVKNRNLMILTFHRVSDDVDQMWPPIPIESFRSLMEKLAKIFQLRDFFSLSECRDILFHLQVHRFTLPQIEAALKSLNLKFLGFEMQDQRTLRKFRESHPNTNAPTSLSMSHEFELDNPDTFIGMYQFWCQKL